MTAASTIDNETLEITRDALHLGAACELFGGLSDDDELIDLELTAGGALGEHVLQTSPLAAQIERALTEPAATIADGLPRLREAADADDADPEALRHGELTTRVLRAAAFFVTDDAPEVDRVLADRLAWACYVAANLAAIAGRSCGAVGHDGVCGGCGEQVLQPEARS
jgi:hypothetical protein